MEKQSLKKVLDKGLRQQYITNRYNSFIETGKLLNRIIILLMVLCFIAIALSVGIVSVGQNFSLVGFNFSIPSWLILIGGEWGIGAIYIYLLALIRYHSVLGRAIDNFYNASYEEDDDVVLRNDFLGTSSIIGSPNFLSILGQTMHTYEKSSSFQNWMDTSVLILILILLFLVPLVTEFLACYKIVILFGWSWWDVFCFILFIVNVGYLITWCQRFLKEGIFA